MGHNWRAAEQPIDNADARPSLFAGLHWGRLAFWLFTGIVLMVGSLLAWHLTEEFLIKDDRFRVAEAEELAGQSPNLVVEGVHYASASQVRHVFAQDFGRSLYLVPIQARREQLLAIDWVQDAAVSKIWPDTLRVAIREREPVAFVRLPPQHARRRDAQLALIDRYGHILRPRVAAKFTLPVISGVRENETVESRRARVMRATALLKEIGPLGAQVSEVDAYRPEQFGGGRACGQRCGELDAGRRKLRREVAQLFGEL